MQFHKTRIEICVGARIRVLLFDRGILADTALHSLHAIPLCETDGRNFEAHIAARNARPLSSAAAEVLAAVPCLASNRCHWAAAQTWRYRARRISHIGSVAASRHLPVLDTKPSGAL